MQIRIKAAALPYNPMPGDGPLRDKETHLYVADRKNFAVEMAG